MSLTGFEINIEGYSGPFDLLCSLVENKKFQISDIKISQLIKIYGLYLLKTRQAPADTLAEFFYMTANLLLEKTKSLLPGAKQTENENSEENLANEENFLKSLERYKPYRKAYHWLSEKFETHSKSFRREVPEPSVSINHEIVSRKTGKSCTKNTANILKCFTNFHAQKPTPTGAVLHMMTKNRLKRGLRNLKNS